MPLIQDIERFLSSWEDACKETFTNHAIAALFKVDIGGRVKTFVHTKHPDFIVKASVGAGNWANVPWISMLNPRITTSTKDGVYPVYLFKADGSGFYLSLNQGTTNPKDKYGKVVSEKRSEVIVQHIRNEIPELIDWENVDCVQLNASTSLGQSYEKPNIAAKFYAFDNLPEEEELFNDLTELLYYYKRVETLSILDSIDTKLSEVNDSKQLGFNTNNVDEPDNVGLSVNFTPDIFVYKPFLLLAGISGTGKTRFVRKQAEATGSLADTYCLSSVRPDWHEPSDLLGYISRLNGTPQFIVTDVLFFIIKAWREILSAKVKFEVSKNGQLEVIGDNKDLGLIRPYWLCLDEMNLAPVEQYFADYLSILETRSWSWRGGSFSYSSDLLLKSSTISQLGEDSTLREDLGLQGSTYDMAWEMFEQYGIGIPFNLIVAGTVNMDETTHGFSRKVIDRAISFDFGAFFPNSFDEFFSPTIQNKALSYPLQAQVSQLDLESTCDRNGEKSIVFLKAINESLESTPFELAYRVLNELLLAVVCAQPQDDKSLIAVWDDFMMCKVLPRIEGDRDKLTTVGGEEILIKLKAVLQSQFASIFNRSDSDLIQRPDLYREKIITDSNSEKTLNIPCRSISKLEWMQQRLVSATFTSFWP
ncbi:DUF3578 domain-containing protein [Cobetia amphilecti]|uniref:MrcB family domain-containing protein n=1 Tax=Cobetia amphilecti TaxID=1055104 RepID=UPI0029420E36|nr:DUF3578 domain-containing protein [Cobetia amphilecti]WOI26048.1 DUF3578 domain-containing protein [Cobetia amphilecti]